MTHHRFHVRRALQELQHLHVLLHLHQDHEEGQEAAQFVQEPSPSSFVQDLHELWQDQALHELWQDLALHELGQDLEDLHELSQGQALHELWQALKASAALLEQREAWLQDLQKAQEGWRVEPM